ncbi:MAG TPA: AAA family ATPase [Terriglobales bacterium]|nr:AAA family ATPase [Terriglobales bacterium]
MGKAPGVRPTREVLDPSRRSEQARQFEVTMRSLVVGQDSALDALAELYQTFLAGLQPPGRPIANLLFLGPTGAGKTRTVEAMAEALFGDGRAVIKVDCAEFQHSHEIAKLIGSPPGYLGHRETHPVLTQEALNQWHTDRCRLSLVLFDEIEKASDALWQLLLGILDRATLTLGDNRRVDFGQAVIFMTSNLGAAEMANLVEGGMGFSHAVLEPGAWLDRKVDRVAVEAARRKFSPEFMNRIDKTVVFRNLRSEDLSAILEIELGRVQQRILAANSAHPFLFQCTPAAKSYLLAEGYDPKYGARHLKRSIERNVVAPLAKLMATNQVKLGDMVRVDLDPAGHMTFTREAEGVLTPIYRDTGPEPAPAPVNRRGASARRLDLPMAADSK